MGKRIDNMRLENGKLVAASKNYRVAGWATAGAKSPGDPVWDTVAAYLKDRKVVEVTRLHTPELKNMGSNPGVDRS